MAVADGVPVVAHAARRRDRGARRQQPAQLADLERRLQRRQAEALMAAGVRLADPARLDVRGELSCGSDVEIDVNCVFEGRVRDRAMARASARTACIRDTAVGAGAEMHAVIATSPMLRHRRASAQVGPFARLRPGASSAPRCTSATSSR